MSRIGERRHACTLEATPEPPPPLCYQTAAMKSSLLPGRIFTPHQPTHNLHLSFLFFFFFYLCWLAEPARWPREVPITAPIIEQAHVAACRAAREAFCSVAAPASRRWQWHSPAFILRFCNGGLPSATVSRCPVHWQFFLATNVTLPTPPSVPCAEKRAR